MKKSLLLIAAVICLTINMAHADLTPQPVAGEMTGYLTGAMNVINAGGRDKAEFMQVLVNFDKNDVTYTILSDDFTVEKKFTLKNENFIVDGRIEGMMCYSSQYGADVHVAKNFFVKNDKWCAIIGQADTNGQFNGLYKIIDEDGNVLGTVGKEIDDPDNWKTTPWSKIIMNKYDVDATPYYFIFTPVETVIEDTYLYEYPCKIEIYTFTGRSSLALKPVATLGGNAYPNPLPAGRTLTVDFQKAADDATYFSITDMTGRQVYRHKVKVGETSCQFNNRRLGHGHYVYTVIYKDGTSVSGRLMAE